MERVGIPKEIKPRERRVALTPRGVAVLAKRSVEVLVEQGAGVGAGYPDADYKAAGAKMAASAAALWRDANLIQKVKEPLIPEFGYLRKDQVLFGYLHLASKEQCELVRTLVKSGITAIGYETVELQGYTPLLKPMSIAAGQLAAYFAGLYKNLAEVMDGKVSISGTSNAILSQMIEQYPEVPIGFPPGHVVVLGGGQAGLAAAQMAVRMRGQVDLVELDPRRRQYLIVYCKDHELPITIHDASKDYVDLLYGADVIIGTVHKPGCRAPVIIPRPLLEEISRGHRKLIIDVSIDQGGNIAESHSTNYDDPLYIDSFGNLRFAVSNMPSICPRKTSQMLEEATLDYTIALAEGLESAVSKYPELRSGINIRDGKILHREVQVAHQYK